MRPATTALSCLLLLSCNQERKAPPAPKARHAAVHSSAAPAPTPTPQPKAAMPAQPKQKRRLCAGQMQQPGRALPDSKLSATSAPGARSPAPAIPVGDGKWTWINFWAAWCVPCKEEMPRLQAWERKLNQAGIPFRLVFVTLDDDERQLDRFLSSRDNHGLQATYWLREGKEREEWLKQAQLDPDLQLPAHLLVDSQKQIRCFVDGAMEDDDYAQLVALLRG